MRPSACGRLVLGPADGQLAVAGLASAPVSLEFLYCLLGRGRRDETLADAPGQTRRFRPARRNVYRREFLRQRVNPCVIYAVVAAAMAFHAALPEKPDDLNGFLEHLEPDVGWRPVRSDDMFIEVLPAADTQKEAARHHGGAGSGGLSDDRRMGPHHGTSDACT